MLRCALGIIVNISYSNHYLNAYELNAYVEILTKIPFFQILIKISTGISLLQKN